MKNKASKKDLLQYVPDDVIQSMVKEQLLQGVGVDIREAFENQFYDELDKAIQAQLRGVMKTKAFKDEVKRELKKSVNESIKNASVYVEVECR